MYKYRGNAEFLHNYGGDISGTESFLAKAINNIILENIPLFSGFCSCFILTTSISKYSRQGGKTKVKGGHRNTQHNLLFTIFYSLMFAL